MPHLEDPPVRFAREEQFRADVQAAWLAESSRLAQLVPGADLQHVGSTAVPGSLTKGDLDIQVRVPAGRFDEAERALASSYARNAGSGHVPGAFAAFEVAFEVRAPGAVSVGVQLTAADGEFDTFWRFRELLLRRSDLREAYDALKRSFDGQPMAAYRAAKNAFFERLRAEPGFAAARLPPTAGVVVRPAAPADREAFEALHREAQALHHRGWPEVFKPPEALAVSENEFAATLARRGTFVRVACRGEEVVGYLHAALQTRPEDACRKAHTVLYVSNLAVAAGARRQGVGARLADDALALAREAGAGRIELDVYVFNAGARAFYARLGFSPHIERLAMDLGAPTGSRG